MQARWAGAWAGLPRGGGQLTRPCAPAPAQCALSLSGEMRCVGWSAPAAGRTPRDPARSPARRRCWGDLGAPAGFRHNMVAISAGQKASCAIRADGAATCFGYLQVRGSPTCPPCWVAWKGGTTPPPPGTGQRRQRGVAPRGCGSVRCERLCALPLPSLVQFTLPPDPDAGYTNIEDRGISVPSDLASDVKAIAVSSTGAWWAAAGSPPHPAPALSVLRSCRLRRRPKPPHPHVQRRNWLGGQDFMFRVRGARGVAPRRLPTQPCLPAGTTCSPRLVPPKSPAAALHPSQ